MKHEQGVSHNGINMEMKKNRMKLNLNQKNQLLLEILFGQEKKWNTHRLIFYSFFILIICYVGSLELFKPEPKQNSSYKSKLLQYDTFIPKDHSLLPIEIANSQSLDSLLGSHAIVDLFVRTKGSGSGLKRVANKIKILRAPKNPNVYAVLCHRSETEKIYKYPGPFYVSLLNPKSTGTNFVNKKRVKRIEVDNFAEL